MTPRGLKRSSPPRPETGPQGFRVSRFFPGLNMTSKLFLKKMVIHRNNFLAFGLNGLEKLFLNIEKKGEKMFRSSDVKPDPPCLLRNLRGPAPRHPQGQKVNPDPPRPLNLGGVPASGSPRRDPVLDTLDETK